MGAVAVEEKEHEEHDDEVGHQEDGAGQQVAGCLSTLAAAAKALGVAHRPINLTAGIRVVAGVYHVQNVNAYDSRLKEWIRRFHGVATHYLDNYLGWFRTLDNRHANSREAVLAMALGKFPHLTVT